MYCLVRKMLPKEFELELEKESVKNLNPITYVVWLTWSEIEIIADFAWFAGNGIEFFVILQNCPFVCFA